MREVIKGKFREWISPNYTKPKDTLERREWKRILAKVKGGKVG